MAKLKYIWQDNAATQDDDKDHYARIMGLEYKTNEDLIHDVADEPGSILKETELRAVDRRTHQKIASYIAQGYGYKCEYFTIKPGLSGIAYDPEAPWDDELHSKTVNIVPGKPLREAAQQIELERVADVKEAPVIETIYDRKSDTTNDRLTPGHTVKITGSQLKIHGQPKGQGLFFVSRADNKEYPAELEENYPTQLRADIPDDLPAGEYTLKIVNTKYHFSTTLRTTLSEIVLTVS